MVCWQVGDAVHGMGSTESRKHTTRWLVHCCGVLPISRPFSADFIACREPTQRSGYLHCNIATLLQYIRSTQGDILPRHVVPSPGSAFSSCNVHARLKMSCGGGESVIINRSCAVDAPREASARLGSGHCQPDSKRYAHAGFVTCWQHEQKYRPRCLPHHLNRGTPGRP